MTDFGEHTQESKSGKWYFSCDEGEKGTLVGIQEPTKWRCPVVGMTRYEVSLDQLQKIDNPEFPYSGPEDGYHLTITPFQVWEQVMGEDLTQEWGAAGGVAWMSTDASPEHSSPLNPRFIIVRLHFAFE